MPTDKSQPVSRVAELGLALRTGVSVFWTLNHSCVGHQRAPRPHFTAKGRDSEWTWATQLEGSRAGQ